MERYTESMLEETALLFQRVFNQEPWNDSWTLEQAKERLLDLYNTPKFIGMVEKEEDEIIGMIFGRGERYFNGLNFQIIEFCVDGKKQGQGIGRRMLAEFQDELRKVGVHYCFLLTCHGARTEGFYEKQGFTTDNGMCMMGKLLEEES